MIADPTLGSDPHQARELTLFTTLCSLLCFGLLGFVLQDCGWLGAVVAILVFGGVGLFCAFGAATSAFRKVDPNEAAFTWIARGEELTRASAGWYCLLRSHNALVYVPKRLSIQIHRQQAGYGTNGQEVSVEVVFNEEIPSPATIRSFRAWYLNLAATCTVKHLRLMQERFDQAKRHWLGPLERRITTDPIDTFLRRPFPAPFHAELHVDEWEYVDHAPF